MIYLCLRVFLPRQRHICILYFCFYLYIFLYLKYNQYYWLPIFIFPFPYVLWLNVIIIILVVWYLTILDHLKWYRSVICRCFPSGWWCLSLFWSSNVNDFSGSRSPAIDISRKNFGWPSWSVCVSSFSLYIFV